MVNFIVEIGINHNGSIDECKKMILESSKLGCKYIKIQKRNPDICVPENQKNKIRKTPWGDMKYIDYKHKIEFNEEQIKELVEYSKSLNVNFFASVWDLSSVDIMSKYTNIAKIGSPCLTNQKLCEYARQKFEILMLSTGMSTEDEIEKAIQYTKPDVIFHTNSTYPCENKNLFLNYILHLKEKYNIQVGYSGHDKGLLTTLATIPMGVEWIERHFTLDKNQWGSDQKASIDLDDLKFLLNGISEIKEALFIPKQNRFLFDSELVKKQSLRNN